MRWPKYRKVSEVTEDEKAAMEEWITTLGAPQLIATSIKKKFRLENWSAAEIRKDYQRILAERQKAADYQKILEARKLAKEQK